MPKSIGKLQKLERLELNCNQFSRLPNTIGSLKELSILNLQDNQLSVLPDVIGQLTILRIDLSVAFWNYPIRLGSAKPSHTVIVPQWIICSTRLYQKIDQSFRDIFVRQSLFQCTRTFQENEEPHADERSSESINVFAGLDWWFESSLASWLFEK